MGIHGRMQGMWTDHALGLPDEDGATTVAVGRLPARTLAQAQVMIQKILTFELQKPQVNRVSLMVGDPGGRTQLKRTLAGAFINSAVELRLKQLDSSWDVTCVMDIEGSKYSVQGDAFREQFLKLLSHSQQFSVYCWHSGSGGPSSSGRTIPPTQPGPNSKGRGTPACS